MFTRDPEEFTFSDPQEFSKNLITIANRSQEIVRQFLERQNGTSEPVDPVGLGKAFFELTQRMMSDPAKMVEAQMALWRDYAALWHSTARRMMGHEREPVITPEKSDRRFRHEDWRENQVFDFIKQSYLLSAQWMQRTVREVDGLDNKTAKKVDFYTRQFVDAMSPSNFVLTNPEVLRDTLKSNGQNLVSGLENLLADLERGKDRLHIRMTDHEAFEVGGNVATSPGKVIYQNELMQLLHYAPATAKVYKRPLLIIPPWINKFYILDLRPDNSFIKWAVERGYTVFVISWVNPDEKLAHKTFEDYMLEGPLDALDAIEQATGETSVNVIGYCIGGTLLAATLAYMAAKGDKRFNAATFFTTQVDFSEPGELEVFIDDEQIASLREKMTEAGYLDGAEMATTFNMLRANDLIWSFVVNNYLLGRDPFPFDLLYWNSDTTRMPRDMHLYYLENMYQKNLLAQPGGLTMAGVPIDLGKITLPIYLQGGREDHIAPFRSVFKAVKLYGGPVRFMLAGSGHIAGVINPPAAKKYQYWLNPKNPKDLEQWLDGAVEHPGSWWPDWHKWLSRKSGPKVPARAPSDGKLKPIEDAPGSYVKTPS